MKIMESNLAGKMLIAMPGMGDPRFVNAVVYICAHAADGAMGLIVNKPATDLRFVDLLDQLDISHRGKLPDIRVHMGGPVEQGRGFVLHAADYDAGGATLKVDASVSMTATVDVLDDIAQGNGPSASMLALGYAGWGPGQLEGEIAQNGWLTCEASPAIVFGRAHEHKWSAALRTLGVDPLTLSAEAGRA